MFKGCDHLRLRFSANRKQGFKLHFQIFDETVAQSLKEIYKYFKSEQCCEVISFYFAADFI